MTERFQTENLFMMFKKISWNLSAQLEVRLGDEEVSGTQVYFLVYLLRHHPQSTYLTELSREIGLSKSLSSREQQQLWNLGQKLLRQLMQTESEETKKDRRLFESEERNTAVKAI